MFELIVISVCLLLNATLSCIEMAFVTVSRPHLKQLANKGMASAQRILKLKESPERTLSVLQVGITLVGAISAAIGGAGAEENLSPILQIKFGLSEETAEAFAIAIIVIPLTYFSVVVGELVPKSLALRFPMKVALAGGILLQVLDKVFAPFVTLLDFSTRILLKFVLKSVPAESPTEINTSVDLEPLSDTSKQYVLNLISIDKRTAKDILVPWDEVTTVDIAFHYTRVMQIIKESRYTRLPVVQEDRVIGILLAKEFVAEGEITRLDWTELIRPIFVIDPKETILSAFKKLQTSKNHMAMVEKDGNALGVITIEDIFVEFVGDIFDEDDSPQTLLSTNSKIRTMNFGPRKK